MKKKVNFNIPLDIKYPIDGYGRVARVLRDNLEFDTGSRIKIFLGRPVERHKEKADDIFGALTMFEADEIPDVWVWNLNMYHDFIIVPSEFCVETFKKCGVRIPIYKVPLYSDNFDVTVPSTDVFTFGHQNSFMEGAQKGWDLVIDAFIKNYADNDKFRLLLKARKSHEWACNKDWIKKASSHKNIEIVMEDYSDEDMVKKFYSRLNCFVFPSRGEGFGLPPLEAMTKGIPTILTNAHGHLEFSQFGISIGTVGKAEPYYIGRVSEQVNGQWVEPNFKELVAAMKDVYDNYVDYKRKMLSHHSELSKRFNPTVFLDKFIETVYTAAFELKNRPIERKKKKVVWVADWTSNEYLGGAQLTNDYMIKKSPFEVEFIRSKDVTKNIVDEWKDKVVILNNITQLNSELINKIIVECNYVRFEHDYGFCEKQDSRHTFDPDTSKCNCYGRQRVFQRLYDNSSLNVFMSLAHLTETRKFLDIKNYVISPSAIATDFIRSNERKTIRNLTILYSTKVNHIKGFHNVLEWSKKSDEPLTAVYNVPYQKMLRLFERSERFIFMPNWVEPFGRVVVEASLANCKVIANPNVGALTWRVDYSNIPKLKVAVDNVPIRFWNNVMLACT